MPFRTVRGILFTNRMKYALALAAVILFAAAPLQTHADMIWFKDAPQDSIATARVIQNVTRRQRFFGRLNKKGDVDYFTFHAKQGTLLHLSLETPAADGKFNPDLTLFGPGLPAPKEDPTINIGTTNGAIIAHTQTNRDHRYDQYLFTTFYEGPTITDTAPKNTTYAIAIRNPRGGVGRYVLHIGTRTSFRWDELLQEIVGMLKGLLRLY